MDELDPYLELRRPVRGRSRSSPAWVPSRSDPDKIADVLINLLANAVKFTPDGGTIRIAAAAEPGATDWVRVSVSDEGVGVPADDQQHLFEPFFTGFDTLRHSSGDYQFGKRGIGLGLWLVKTFVEMHGGRVEVSSSHGQGSTFSFLLPRRRPAADPGRTGRQASTVRTLFAGAVARPGTSAGIRAGTSSPALDVIPEIAEEGGQAGLVPCLLDRFLEPLVLGLEVPERLGVNLAEVDARDLIVGVDREHEARLVGPGLDLQLHVGISVIPQPEGIDRRRLTRSLAGPLERRPGQGFVRVALLAPFQASPDDLGDGARSDRPCRGRARRRAATGRAAPLAGRLVLPPWSTP